jgi:hypothetical protein
MIWLSVLREDQGTERFVLAQVLVKKEGQMLPDIAARVSRAYSADIVPTSANRRLSRNIAIERVFWSRGFDAE